MERSAAGVLARRSWAPLRVVADPLSWRSAVYLLAAMWFGIAWFVLIVTGVSLTAGLLVIWVGLLVGAALLTVLRLGGLLERRILWLAFGVRIADPYRPLPAGGNPLRKLRTMATDPATWKDLLYFLLLFPIGIVEFTVSVAMWASAGMMLFLPLVVLASGSDEGVINFGGPLVMQLSSPLKALPFVPFGMLLAVLALYLVRIMAFLHASLAKALLSPGQTQELRARTAHLQASRARGVDAAEAERRRIERDLHDGAQQQLLAVAMDIGRARAKLESDPEAARALIEQAHAGTREAIVELRNLARGIYPAILTDRGLDAALSSLAARAPVPVEVSVDLPSRPPAVVESIAYFVVAEALANIAKYARATRAEISVTRDQHWVIVEVSDNGVGGATAAAGGGLAGLADRAATIDGILTVNSPLGGPTVIRCDLPSTW